MGDNHITPEEMGVILIPNSDISKKVVKEMEKLSEVIDQLPPNSKVKNEN